MQTVKNIVITAILTGSIAGCTDAYTAIGNKWTEINSRVIVIDTCSVDISSIKLDSIITSQGNTVYAGIRKSQYWGTTRMSTYMTFKTTQDYSSNNTPEYEEEIIFDSLTLYLLPDSTHVFGWTRCVEMGCPANLELEMYVNPDIPTIFYSQSFCSKAQLAKYLANKYNGLYIDVDDFATKSTKAKIEAFIKLR